MSGKRQDSKTQHKARLCKYVPEIAQHVPTGFKPKGSRAHVECHCQVCWWILPVMEVKEKVEGEKEELACHTAAADLMASLKEELR